jgi:flagellar protein FliO/FliZ
MSAIVGWIVGLAVVAALAAAGILFFKAYRSGTTPGELLFRPKPLPRLGVIEYTNVDGKRKLVLIRRDDVEHLIMTGGPVDVVIETGIGEPAKTSAENLQPPPLTFTRPPRAFAPVATPPAMTPANLTPNQAAEEAADFAFKR